MRKIGIKAISLVCTAALMLSMASCTKPDNRHSGGRRSGPGTKIEGGTPVPTLPVDPTITVSATPTPTPSAGTYGDYIPTSDALTYPDHVATYDEIHPYHAPGTVKGSAAQKLLSDVEMDILHHEIDSYADIVILFENPEKLGFSVNDVSWGEFTTIDEYDDEKAYYQQQLDSLYTIDYESLGSDDRLCYDLIVYDIEETIYGYSYTAFEYYEMNFNALTGPQCNILFDLEIFAFDTVKDAEDYIKLVKDIDRYFDLLCEYEESRAAYGFASSDNSYEEAAKSFDSLVEQKDDCFLYYSFEERLDNIKDLSTADKDRLIQENEKAMKEVMFPEFEECASRMRALEGSGGTDAGLCRYRGGDAYYAVINRHLSNKGVSVEESISALDNAIDATYAKLYQAALTGTGWDKEYEDHAYSKGSVEDNMDYLYSRIEEDFPAIPAHAYFLMEVPEAFEDYFSPAACMAYHLDTFNSNCIIVNNKSVGGDLGTTIAHEAYPGHMYQSIYTRSRTSHPYMYLAGSIGYKEGWATYVQEYSCKYFADNQTAGKLVGITDNLNTLISTKLDYGIHAENWSLKDCVDYLNDILLSQGAGDEDLCTEDDLADAYTILIMDPGYFIKYGMGNVWTTQIMDNMHAKHPDKTDLEIHTAYLDSLTGTFEQIEANTDKLLS